MQIVDTIKVLKAADVSIKTLDGSVIEAKVNLGYENRVSDLFTKTDNSFIVLFDAVHLGSPKKKLLVVKCQDIDDPSLTVKSARTSMTLTKN